ncbi:MAG: hypothetical protein RL220_690 [Bacteroidota bacterium]|jgi:hypothetical protein
MKTVAMRVQVLLLCLFALSELRVIAQSQEPAYTIINYYQTEWFNSVWYEQGGDTLAKATFRTVLIEAKAPNRIQKKSYDKTMERVQKVYPYAHLAGDIMAQYDEKLKSITTERERKALLDEAEEAMKARFEKELKKLTVKEGLILIKLIDRETGQNSYELVQELKGNFSAFMWQGLARLFGHNLKTEYDPYSDRQDIWIENVCQMIEQGDIPVQVLHVEAFK